MESSRILEESTHDLHLPSAYDTAMDALSSLITSKRRGDGSTISVKYDKLDRMLMYIKILGLEELIAGLKIIHVAGTKGKAVLELVPYVCFSSYRLVIPFHLQLGWGQVDVAIIEVGLGGTRDSTNVIKDPVVCGVSPLGMDHMETLGDTLRQIASHKAGIFKPLVPAFTVPQLSEAMDVLQEKARICWYFNLPLDLGVYVPLEVVAPLDRRDLKGKELSLSGDHQLTNAGLAVALCKSWLQRTGNWEKLFQHVGWEDDAGLEDNLPEAFLRVFQQHVFLEGLRFPESMEACATWFSSAVKEDRKQSSVPSLSSKLQTLEEVWSNGHVQLRKNESAEISKKILLFNCMDVRDPQILLPTLVDTCALSGIYFKKAIFVPSISTYSKVTSGSSAIPADIRSKDLTWQFNLQRVWEKIIHGKDAVCKSSEMQKPENTPPRSFIHEDVSICSPADGRYACSAVVSSLPMTINWLRDYAKENPASRIQVLVTGSLHLVGDVLKLLRR
ncbi:hypothetical protein DH2020_041527 [Rehmannia glutinosa]|uniref:tetrahydrofolate synthase n=1 Tax=Rehmannia glutinosa TaxID=99300 RepID=A0ABR0UQX4_REHGL